MSFAGILRIGAAALLLGAAGCATKYYAVGDSAKGDGGVYCYAVGEDQPAVFSPVGTLNYLIAGPCRDLFYGTVRDLPGGGKNDGGVVLLRRDRGDRFTVDASTPTRSDNPCHLSLSPDGKYLFTANYGSGTVSVLPVWRALPGAAELRYHTGSGPTSRQKAPHPHFAGFDPQGGALYVTDLGTDSIYVYCYHPGRGLSRAADQVLTLHSGAGPRHLVFAPAGDVLFVANELDSTVTSFRKNLISGHWQPVLTLPTRFKPDDPQVRNYPGAITATRDGKFFLVSNRGANTIALFENYGGGRFTLLAEVPSGGDFPYDFAFADRETRLIVPHRKSGNVSNFRFDRETKTLTRLPGEQKVPVAARVMAK
ncbi:MAG: lactonase family protein [Victivallaceae bacterium]